MDVEIFQHELYESCRATRVRDKQACLACNVRIFVLNQKRLVRDDQLVSLDPFELTSEM